MSKAKNWFEELPIDKQMEYCSRLKGKRRSKYCTIEGKPKGPNSLKPVLEVASEPLAQPLEEILKDNVEAKLLLEEGILKPEDVMKETEKDYYDFDSKYEWAKKSDIQNIGEDIAGSARHTRNSMKDWDEKDALVNLNIKINRKVLEKKNCPDFEMSDEKNLLKAFALREALNEFPSTVPGGNDKDDRELLIGRRKAYLDAYNSTVAKIRELLADPNVDARQALDSVKDHYLSLYKENREGQTRDFGNSMWTKYRRIYGTNGPMAKLRMALRKIEANQGNTNAWSNLNYKMELGDNDKKFVRNLINGKEKLTKRRVAEKNGFDERDIYANNKNFKIDGAHKVRSNDDAVAFMKRFARGVQFGNAMPDDERKTHLVAAAQSLEDLSSVTGVSLNSLMQNGKVALAFGARGRNMAAAHYEPGQKVINMTRNSGYGSLAHEMGHALDHFAGEISNGGSYLSKRYYPGDEQTTVHKHFSGVHKTIQEIQNRIVNSESYARMRPKQRAYWTARHEVFARLFEGYVNHKLKKSGKTNSYLVSIPNQSVLWPTDDEIKSVEADMESFLKAYEQDAARKKS